MTACTNKARGAVVAALAGVLALGAVPAVALATGTADAQVDLLVSDAANAFSKGTVGLDNTADVQAGASAGEYVATDKGSALKFAPRVVYLTNSTAIDVTGDDYELVFYKADKGWNRTGSELTEVVDAGNYVVVRAVDGEYAGGEAEAKLTVSGKQLPTMSDTNLYVVNPDDAKDFSHKPTFTGSALEIGVNVTENGEALVEGEDYEVKFLHKGDSATDPEVEVLNAYDGMEEIDYVAYVTGINEYAGEVEEIDFNVAQFDIGSDTSVVVNDVIGNGAKPTHPDRVIKNTDGTELDPSLVDITVDAVWGENREYDYSLSASEDAGLNVTVSSPALTPVNKVANEVTFEYDGEALGDSLAFDKTNDECFDFADLKVYAGEEELTSGADYTITVRDSSGAVVPNNDVELYGGVYEVTVKVDASQTNWEYGGSRTFTVRSTYGTIDADANITAYYEGEVVTSVEKWYDGDGVSLAPSASGGNLNVTVEDANGDITGSDNYTVTIVDADGKDVTSQAFTTGLVDAGAYTLKVESEKFDFTGTTELPIVIHKADLANLKLNNLETYKSSEYLPLSNASTSVQGTLDVQYNKRDVKGEDLWSTLPSDVWNTDTVSIEKWDAEKGEWVKDSANYCDEAGKYRFVIKGSETLAKNFEYANDDYTTTYEFVAADRTQVNASFDDVLPTDWFFNCVNVMHANGSFPDGTSLTSPLIKGYADTSVFGPNDTITRADVTVILYRMAGGMSISWGGEENQYDETKGWKTGFYDIDEAGLGNMYYARAVAWAKASGVVNGYQDGTFGPNDAITREQLATMLANYAKVVDRATVELDEDALATMPDAGSVSDWAEKAVSWAVAEGLMGNGGSINPTASITRAETAAMAYNYLK